MHKGNTKLCHHFSRMIKRLLKYIIPIVCLTLFVQGWAAAAVSNKDKSHDNISTTRYTANDELVADANSSPFFETIITFSRPASLFNAPRQQNGQRRVDTWLRYSLLPVKVVKHNYCREGIHNILNLKFLALSEPSDRLALLGKFII